MTPKQFESEMNYLVARHIVENFLKQGFLTKIEFRKIDAFLVETFVPLVGKLITEALDNTGDKSE
ncbi:SHOCT domain-containing protein [uncultured Ruminobacter sp.]|uniref:SHOCT domain-containing protein n=1 Tax=Ruminobacter amylophilus TaxID=867 RepID=UPI0025CF37B7|nr:SHOCT domain-containing protein [uncultured Ruminobacter sp.]